MKYRKDIQVGESYRTNSLQISEQDIIEFATEFDPQPYHLDKDAGDASIFGGLCASGWQVSAMMMRLLTDTFRQNHIPITGVASVPQMRWRTPVFAGDTLTAQVTLTSSEVHSRNHALDCVSCAVEVENQRSERVLSMTINLLISRQMPGSDGGDLTHVD